MGGACIRVDGLDAVSRRSLLGRGGVNFKSENKQAQSRRSIGSSFHDSNTSGSGAK